MYETEGFKSQNSREHKGTPQNVQVMVRQQPILELVVTALQNQLGRELNMGEFDTALESVNKLVGRINARRIV